MPDAPRSPDTAEGHWRDPVTRCGETVALTRAQQATFMGALWDSVVVVGPSQDALDVGTTTLL